MPATAIAMPRLGMTMEEGTVVAWPLATGSRVAKGQVVLVIESEKSEVEIEAPASGVLRHVYVGLEETVPCGTLLGAITDSADEPFDPEAFRAAAGAAAPRRAEPALELKLASASGPAPQPGAGRRPVAPAARAAARKLGIDPASVRGTGPGGRVTREDVEAFAAAREALVPVAPGVCLEVRVEGEGEAVLLLPGLGTDVSVFASQVPALGKSFRVHAVNPRGVGLSDAPEDERYDVRQTAEDAAAAVPQQAGGLHVIGASLGAAAALELALLHPARVRTLTLITPFVEASPRLLAVADAWSRLAAQVPPETLAAALLPWLFSETELADEARRRRALRGLAQTLARVPAATLARSLAGLRRWSGSRRADLARVAVPTLVIAAGGDLLTQDGEAIAAAIPGARRHVVTGAGHAVALEAAESVSRALLEHLRGSRRDPLD